MMKAYITNYDLNGHRIDQSDYIFSDKDISSVTTETKTIEEALDILGHTRYHSTYNSTKIKTKYKGFGKNKKVLYKYFDASTWVFGEGMRITDENPIEYTVEIKEVSFPSIEYIMKHYSADKAINILAQLGLNTEIATILKK